MYARIPTFLIASLIVAAAPAVAVQTAPPSQIQQVPAPPPIVPIAGTLLTASGQPQTATTTITISIYGVQKDGTPLWQEKHTVTPDERGHYGVTLGSATPGGVPTTVFATSDARWLGIQTDGLVEQPRILLTSVPYALKAGDANTLGGLPVSAFVVSGHSVDESARRASARADGATGAATSAVPDPSGHVTSDQVIADDLIVQGSTCVGLDCVNNEVFGFATLMLKENNTRILFNDTSTGTGFPANDWQLTANDSASGGANKFSIEDITGGLVPFTVTAGAPTNSIFVSAAGRLGLGTNAPVKEVHAIGSDTPGIRLDQSNAGGFAPQIWDVAGNETNFFVRDVTGGSRLPLRIRPGAPTSSIDINAAGFVGIGTPNPSQRLYLFSAGASDNVVEAFENGSRHWSIGINGPSNFFRITDNTANLSRITILNSGNVGIGTNAPDQKLSVNGDANKVGGGSWLTFSDERLKNISGGFTSGLDAVMQLQPIRYEYKPDNALGLPSEGEHIGFGAQTLQKVIPEAVTKNAEGYLMVNNDPILWTMLNAIKDQQKEIAELQALVRELQAAQK